MEEPRGAVNSSAEARDPFLLSHERVEICSHWSEQPPHVASPSGEVLLHDWEVEIHPENVQRAHAMPMLLEWLFGVTARQLEAVARAQLLLSSPASPGGR